MIRQRATASTLPWRVYERYGARIWRIWYQPPTGQRVTLLTCFPGDMTRAQARAQAKLRYQQLYGATPEALPEALTFRKLGGLYFDWQRSLPEGDDERKADTTIEENEREFKTLAAVFGDMEPDAIEPHDWYTYQDKRREKGHGAKANKEIALASSILNYGMRRGLVERNTAKGTKRVKTRPRQRRVTLAEIDALLPIARAMGPGATLQVLCARAALLCLRRPGEILALRPADVTGDGILFTATKRKAGEIERRTLIEWSDALRETIAEAESIKRHVNISPLVFGNLSGERYTRSGWGANWRRLMRKAADKIHGFVPFTLQDCRPGGVTDKRERGDTDTQDATMHADVRMIDQVYDRRRTRRATPAK